MLATVVIISRHAVFLRSLPGASHQCIHPLYKPTEFSYSNYHRRGLENDEELLQRDIYDDSDLEARDLFEELRSSGYVTVAERRISIFIY